MKTDRALRNRHHRGRVEPLVAFVLGIAAVAVLASAIWAAASPKQKAAQWPPLVSVEEMELLKQVRVIALTLRAPCCPELSVAQHDSPQTLAMKRDIREMLVQGKGRSAIVSALVEKYGDSIVGGSSGQGWGWAMYVAPPALALLLVVLLGRFMATRRGKSPQVLHLQDDRWPPDGRPKPTEDAPLKKAS